MRATRLTFTFLLFVSSVLAQVPSTKKASKVTVAPTPTVKVLQGGKSEVRFMFRVIPGYHINSNQPNSELLIPTRINFSVPTNISMTGVSYPPGEDYTFSFSPDEKLSVYTGDFTVNGNVMASKATTKGTYRVHATLRYQACDNRACYPPASVPFSFDVNVQKPTAPKTPKKNPGQSPHIHK